jgi:hypothetical protein|tara:strand:+ start:305 stop:619 length:315 start_codon:yes stop_codon:yes gene_type:complete
MVTESKRIIDLTSIELTNALSFQFNEQLHKSEERILKVIKSNSQASEIDSKLLSIQETADLFNVTRATIHDWMNKGIVKHYKKGNRTYFFHSELIESLKQSNKR